MWPDGASDGSPVECLMKGCSINRHRPYKLPGSAVGLVCSRAMNSHCVQSGACRGWAGWGLGDEVRPGMEAGMEIHMAWLSFESCEAALEHAKPAVMQTHFVGKQMDSKSP